YSPKHQRLYQVTLDSYRSLGSFGRVAVMAEGLLLSGTPGADRISLKAFRLNTYYHENRVVSRRQFGVMVEGQGGSDVIQINKSDLSFFSRIILHPGLAEEQTDVKNQAQTRIELKVPAFLYQAGRRGQNLVLSHRFEGGNAGIVIQGVWPKQHDRFPQPTTLVFNDLQLTLSDLAARVMRSGQGVVFPLTAGNRKNRLRFIHANASNPLYIRQAQNRPVKIVTHQAMDGIKLTLEPLNPTHTRRQVFITGTNQWGWEPGSVQVSGPKPGSHYRPWPFIPAVISSSAMGNRTLRLWGNDRNNILYVGAHARQWSILGRGGNDLLLLGTSGNAAARPEVLANWTRSDRCDNRKLEAPGNSSLWQAFVDWTRPLIGGPGNDVYDLRACRPARTVDDYGKHYILLSSGSKADLRRLTGDNSTALFFTDLTAKQVGFNQCDPQEQSSGGNLTLSNGSLPLRSRSVRIINTDTNQTLALIKPDVLASLHFKGGQVSLSPTALINSNDSALAESDSADGNHEALSFLNRIIRRGQRLVHYLSSLARGGKDDADTDTAKSKQQGVVSLNDTELNQHYQRLVQDISALSGHRTGESPSFMPSATQRVIQNLTNPQPLTTMGQG
ncbi:hypothetical protein, partial [Endozoicomonas sp. SESOKO2]|uniref:hypothetical protein n=2 Tax=unclassified Endozoicomonas TaxID=2644528 RepID=UPI0021486511